MRKKKEKTASSEIRTHDPWFTRPVLCHWAIEAHFPAKVIIVNHKIDRDFPYFGTTVSQSVLVFWCIFFGKNTFIIDS